MRINEELVENGKMGAVKQLDFHIRVDEPKVLGIWEMS